MLVRAPHSPDPDHLEEVTEQMKEIGAPTIRAYYDGEIYWALEGSHRLAAAHKLGLFPEIVELEESDEIDHDFEDVSGRTVGDVLEYLSSGAPDPDADWWWDPAQERLFRKI